jgi:hypothetical protein
MMKTLNTPTAQLVAGLLIAAAVVVAFVIGGDSGSALVNGGTSPHSSCSCTSAAGAASRSR